MQASLITLRFRDMIFATYVMQRDLQAPPAARHRGAISRHLHLDDCIFFFEQNLDDWI
jgi:hypothetical protein